MISRLTANSASPALNGNYIDSLTPDVMLTNKSSTLPTSRSSAATWPLSFATAADGHGGRVVTEAEVSANRHPLLTQPPHII